MTKQMKKYVAEFVQLYVRQNIVAEVAIDLMDDWTLHIKKNILDDTFEEYRYFATRDGIKKLHIGYYYPSEDTLHVLC